MENYIPCDIGFVERKNIDFSLFNVLLEKSISNNRVSNFGPVSKELESELSLLNGIDSLQSNFKAICGSSATLLISAVAAALDNRYQTSLRWAVCDFGFFTNFTGPVKTASKVKCNSAGMLDIDQLALLPDDSFDVVMVTNVFGWHDDFEDYFRFCRQKNKILIVDNAAGFGSLANRHMNSEPGLAPEWIEIVSLHHTKPWGFGEGGVAFADSELVKYIAAALNFGISPEIVLEDSRWVSNGKMSEVAAAAIMCRVRDRQNWVSQYRDQTHRIMNLACKAGLVPLSNDLPSRHVVGQIGFLSKRPVSRHEIDASILPLEKYYRPTVGFGSGAMNIYNHMINIPTHASMSFFSDETIINELKCLL
ncbi:DegT/DnrJ/EryC1/StrS family aminotransferase [Larsenimonas rhizosphaerae]|uniref:DegT/DnrJ/EryC1/StrS family aminotransferase n=1 Tax=Larsenimonas rhizosphaerae TaxID=2944682 RepID=UPI002034253F|nr:DegT/DnrJ/EryC1/StrS family aminotransferase [Larsenimonas rhizosphaerae]MCM2131852.1 DegT/DnrJ/EryC1/StrS family aminotransferase [Larsenimonas rhizosphaerae]